MFTFIIEKNDFKIIPNTINTNKYDFYYKNKLLFTLEETISQLNTRKNIKLIDTLFSLLNRNYEFEIKNKKIICKKKNEIYKSVVESLEFKFKNDSIEIDIPTCYENKKDIKKYNNQMICDNCKKIICV